MKYSRNKRAYHLEMILGILSEDPDASSRAVWQDLRGKDVFLDRGYVNKLVSQAHAGWAQKERNRRIMAEEREEWRQVACQIVDDFYTKIREHIRNQPRLIGLDKWYPLT